MMSNCFSVKGSVVSVLDDIIAGVLDDLKEREDRVPLSRVKEMEQAVPEAKDALGVSCATEMVPSRSFPR